MSLDAILSETKERRENGQRLFAESDPDLCMLCDAHGADKRGLFIDCFYAIYEAVPEALDIALVEDPRGRGYYLCICKSCRGRLLGHLRAWADECRSYRGLPNDHDGGFLIENPDATIPVRVDGRVVMMTPDEYKEWRHV